MNILITGITGFVGSYLAEHILSLNESHKIYGLCRWRSSRDTLKNCIDRIRLIEGDLMDLSSMIGVINNSKPDIIFHLAAQSYVQTSFDSPIDTLQRNIIGTANLLEAIKLIRGNYIYENGDLIFDPIIQIASSSEVYGQVDEKYQPTTEESPLRPASPYAVSKVGEDFLGYQYYLSYNFKILRTRLFSHSGARRGEVFMESAFAKQVAGVKLGLLNEIRVGNLNSKRTFIDVRDAVRAYWLLVTQVQDYGEVFNIGGNVETRVEAILNKLITIAQIKEPKIIIDAGLIRPSDVTSQIPDSSKFINKTGWKPSYDLTDTLLSLYIYWVKELSDNPWKIKSVV